MDGVTVDLFHVEFRGVLIRGDGKCCHDYDLLLHSLCKIFRSRHSLELSTVGRPPDCTDLWCSRVTQMEAAAQTQLVIMFKFQYPEKCYCKTR
jgi:hypothetical protein